MTKRQAMKVWRVHLVDHKVYRPRTVWRAFHRLSRAGVLSLRLRWYLPEQLAGIPAGWSRGWTFTSAEPVTVTREAAP